jgi:hypothetical protein
MGGQWSVRNFPFTKISFTKIEFGVMIKGHAIAEKRRQ